MTPETILEGPAEATPERFSTTGMTTKVVKGSVWTLAGQIAPLLVTLVTTPFVIRMLGAESYGVLILVAMIPGYLGFADLGMGLASTKFASEAYAEGALERETRIVRTAALIALASSVPVTAVLFAFSSAAITFFNIPPSLRAQASLALKYATVTFLLNFLNGIFNTPQLTRMRMDLAAFVTSGCRIVGILCTPFAVYSYGIVGGAFVLMIASFLALICNLAISNRLAKDLFELSIDRSSIRPLLKFGAAFVGATIAAVLLVNIEKGVLAATVSAAALAHYSVAFTLAGVMTMFSGAMVQSLIPAFSQLQSLKSRAQLNALYSRGIRISLIFFIPVMAVASVLAKPFFTAWAGEEFGSASSPPFYILLVGVAFNILAFLPNAAIMSAGRTDVLAKLYWLELFFYAGLVWFLASGFGAIGAALAWTTRVTVDSFLQFAIAKRVAGTTYIGRRSIPFAIVIGIMSLPLMAALYFASVGVAASVLAVWIVLYSVFIWKNILEREEIDRLTESLSSRMPKARASG